MAKLVLANTRRKVITLILATIFLAAGIVMLFLLNPLNGGYTTSTLAKEQVPVEVIKNSTWEKLPRLWDKERKMTPEDGHILDVVELLGEITAETTEISKGDCPEFPSLTQKINVVVEIYNRDNSSHLAWEYKDGGVTFSK